MLYFAKNPIWILLNSKCFVAVESSAVGTYLRDSVNVHYLFCTGFSLERFVVDTDRALTFEDCLGLMVLIFEPFIVKLFLSA